MLDNLPQQRHLVIASLEDPPLPLHWLRSSGLMTGIYALISAFRQTKRLRFYNRR